MEFATFPLAPGTKVPLAGSHGYKDAVIGAEISDGCNVGIAAAASGLIILDVDRRNDGVLTLAELEDRYGRLPATYSVLTPGGMHYYFRAPSGITIRRGSNVLGHGLDLPAYVVGAGSIVDGVTYEVMDDFPIADAPRWMIDLLRGTPRTTTREPAGGMHRHTPDSPCSVCGGWQTMPHGRGVRCHGFDTDQFVYCSREEYGGQPIDQGLFRHLVGGCGCGETHRRRPKMEVSEDVEGDDLLSVEGVDPVDLVELLPEPLAQFTGEVAKSVGVSAEMVVPAVISETAAAMGNMHSLELKIDDIVYAIFWMAVVAPPGTGKTPAEQKALEPLRYVQAKAFRAFHAAWAKYKAHPDQYPVPPVMEHFWTSDITVEAIADSLSTSPGLLVAPDELSGWVADYNRYRQGKGGDRQRYLSL